MSGFETKNSKYYVDLQNKRIAGGFFGTEWHEYSSARIMVGEKAVITLLDGRVVGTNVVTAYI